MTSLSQSILSDSESVLCLPKGFAIKYLHQLGIAVQGVLTTSTAQMGAAWGDAARGTLDILQGGDMGGDPTHCAKGAGGTTHTVGGHLTKH